MSSPIHNAYGAIPNQNHLAPRLGHPAITKISKCACAILLGLIPLVIGVSNMISTGDIDISWSEPNPLCGCSPYPDCTKDQCPEERVFMAGKVLVITASTLIASALGWHCPRLYSFLRYGPRLSIPEDENPLLRPPAENGPIQPRMGEGQVAIQEDQVEGQS
jgi:hypothetical protein